MAYLAAKKLWHGLGTGPWVCNERNPYTDPLIAEILGLMNGQVVDYPGAEYRRRLLVDHKFLTVKHLDDGTLEFTRAAECPPKPEPDTRTWVDRENERIREEVARQQAMLNREYELRKAAEDRLNEPIKAIERANFAYRLNEHGGLAKLEARLDAIEASLEQLTRQTAAQYTGAGNELAERVA